MVNHISVHNGGWLVHGGNKIEGDPLTFLNHAIELDESWLLRDYFHLLENYPVLAKLNPFCSQCQDKYSQCEKGDCRTDTFVCLEFTKSIEMIGFPGEPRLEIFTSLKGWDPDQTHSLEAFELQHLLDMPLRLGNLKHVIFGDRVDAFEFETVYSLFEFVDGIAWELSFQGRPQTCRLQAPQ